MTEICYRRPDDAYPRQVAQLVRDQGWVVEHDARPEWPAPVTSTIGLCRRAHPEFMVFGCDAPTGLALLEPLALAVQDGHRLLDCDQPNRFYPGAERIELIYFPLTTSYLPTVNQLFRRNGTAPIPAQLLLRTDLLEGPLTVAPRPVRKTTYLVSEFNARHHAAKAGDES
ncbi:DUF4262 domain-containing protein [Kribbella italica]|uniref:DUF4262 domain-containing protein n=1 Tax=Kribbella italica TaxID=1540520 RepID=A0A7W9J3G2_9ACTN|nr:DUF4262 domain-containing protein [Kribbella italica]MBB5834445.1 hypothetical protein [Kribbella italica]